MSTPAPTHHHDRSKPSAIPRSRARTTVTAGNRARRSVGRAGKPRLVAQFASRPWHGAGEATSIDGPGRPLQGRRPAAASPAPPSNLGCLLLTSTTAAVAREQDGLANNGEEIRENTGPSQALPQSPTTTTSPTSLLKPSPRKQGTLVAARRRPPLYYS